MAHILTKGLNFLHIISNYGKMVGILFHAWCHTLVAEILTYMNDNGIANIFLLIFIYL